MNQNIKSKIYSLAILNLLFVSAVFSQVMHPKRNQEGLYFEVSGGYGQGIVQKSGHLSSQTPLHIIDFGISAGYRITKHFGLELGLGDFEEWTKSTYVYINSDATENVVKFNMLPIQPSLVFQFGKNKLKCYIKTGFLLFIPILQKKEEYSIHNSLTSTDYIQHIYGGNKLYNLQASSGLSYDFNTKYALFAGIQWIYQLPLDYPEFAGNANSFVFNLGLRVSLGKKFWKDKARYNLGSSD
jgi:hypothetical protein